MDNRVEFSVRLKKLRKEFGFTPKQFAKQLGVGQQSYYGYESGRVAPSFDALINIAEKCNTSLDWLCGITPIQNIQTQAGIQRAEIARILSELLAAEEVDKRIELHISCGNAVNKNEHEHTLTTEII